jgi:hypothetical protein
MILFLIVITLLTLVTSAFATNIYYNEVEFKGQITSNYYLEDFSGYQYGIPLDGTSTDADFGPVNGYSWSASASVGLWSMDGALTTNLVLDTLTITFTGQQPTAVAGLFTAIDSVGNHITQQDLDIIVMLNDGTSVTINGSGDGFLGFTSIMPISYMTVKTGTSNPDFPYYWAQLDHFYVGAASVPEPATMLLLGFGIIGLAGMRRKFKK